VHINSVESHLICNSSQSSHLLYLLLWSIWLNALIQALICESPCWHTIATIYWFTLLCSVGLKRGDLVAFVLRQTAKWPSTLGKFKPGKTNMDTMRNALLNGEFTTDMPSKHFAPSTPLNSIPPQVTVPNTANTARVGRCSIPARLLSLTFVYRWARPLWWWIARK
jgi:hypothetical protein